ncbi:hypothetical protein ISF_09233 [Cordyceps fumosorosea ARSEF 2679]|uniref:Concanavalin A-like lectin/glucanase n=1 Tax=Cordyceps fumosorosea (strain ARSEF 2679) TaxID=1081104 RepID=A0A162M9D2_CORFA|nr:hypothetical protein ISF_09233 [Cordyceps fumosorosea ARSEF 2679]OAA52850.1 hypothetical protein ISF_09233 [Cordyceps fumosorosea ARSEF 2679]
MLGKIIVLALSATSTLAAVSPVGGSGWKVANPSFNVQTCEGGRVAGNEFSLPAKPDGSGGGAGCSNGHPRAERRYANDYSSGKHQFGGQLTINSFAGDRVSLKQTFNGDDGPFFILGVKRNGDLYSVRDGGKTIAAGAARAGRTVTVNTVHDAGGRMYQVYVDGQLKYTASAPGGSFYDKIGTYTTDSGRGPIDVTWSNIGFWTE